MDGPAFLTLQNKQLRKHLIALQADFDLLAEYVSHVNQVVQDAPSSTQTSLIIQKMRDLRCSSDSNPEQYCHLAPDLESSLLKLRKRLSVLKVQLSNTKQIQYQNNLIDANALSEAMASIDQNINALAHFTLPNTPQPFSLPSKFFTSHPSLPTFEEITQRLPPLSTKQRQVIESIFQDVLSKYTHGLRIVQDDKETLEAELSQFQQSYSKRVEILESDTKKVSSTKIQQIKLIKEPVLKMIHALEELSQTFSKQTMVSFCECVEASLSDMLNQIEKMEKSPH